MITDMERIDTVVIGAGQAGLATSYYLRQQARPHIVLEQGAMPSQMWRNRVWDSFTLITPNWAFSMPGMPNKGDDAAFMTRAEIVEFFEAYVDCFDLPVQYNTRVDAVEAVEPAGFRVQTPARTFVAENVVMATGWCQQPKLPPFAKDVAPEITQLHSSEYRNPGALPKGAVLVVGSGQSGCQIAEELHEQGRKVFLSTGGAGRAPRRYRGKDVFEWLNRLGYFDRTPEQLPPGTPKFAAVPHVSGREGGRTLNLHEFARNGMTLLGHMRGAQGKLATFAPDLYENLTKADTFAEHVAKMVDALIAQTGLDAPEESLPQWRDGFDQPVIEELDLHAAGVSSIIWATGYTFDYSLVKLPVHGKDGLPIVQQGITQWPGLYFVGLPWSPTQRPGILLGVGESARQVAEAIRTRAPISA